MSAACMHRTTNNSYRGEDGVHVGNEEPSRYQEGNTNKNPANNWNWDHAQELYGCQAAVRVLNVCIEMRTYRDGYPYELAVSPHCNRFDNAPFPHSHIAQCEPQEYGYTDSVGVDEAHSGGEQTKVVLEDCSRRVSGI